MVAIESNYDPFMEEHSGRPWQLKRRIMGGSGHLSNEQAFAEGRRAATRLRGNQTALEIGRHSRPLHADELAFRSRSDDSGRPRGPDAGTGSVHVQRNPECGCAQEMPESSRPSALGEAANPCRRAGPRRRVFSEHQTGDFGPAQALARTPGWPFRPELSVVREDLKA